MSTHREEEVVAIILFHGFNLDEVKMTEEGRILHPDPYYPLGLDVSDQLKVLQSFNLSDLRAFNSVFNALIDSL